MVKHLLICGIVCVLEILGVILALRGSKTWWNDNRMCDIGIALTFLGAVIWAVWCAMRIL